MQLHTVTIFYRRQAQPAQYEAEEARLEGSATVEDGEDFEAVAYDLLTRARVQAHRALGLKVPAIADFEPAFEEAQIEVVAPCPNEGARIGDKAANLAHLNAGAAKRRRRTKAEMEAARAAEKSAGYEIISQEGVTVEETPLTDDIVIGGEAAAAEPDFQIEDAPIDDKTLQAEAAAVARKVGANGATKVKDLMREFKVARLGEIAQERRAEFVAQLKALAA